MTENNNVANNEVVDDEEFMIEDIDLEAIYKTMAEIEKDKQDRLNAMTPEEREAEEKIQKQAEIIDGIVESIQQRRIEREIEFSKMSPEEALKAYQEINKRAQEFAEEIGMESVDVETIWAEKNKK
jgi:hypothetical protein